LKPTAARFEGGSENMAGFIGLGASIDLLMSFGFDAIGRRVLQITDRACEELASAGATISSRREDPHASGIVSFSWPGDPAKLQRRLAQQGIVLSCRGGRLRISPHAYNNEQDVERLVDALRNPG
jgi:selenocysteine lyase/cysteine desulfurase